MIKSEVMFTTNMSLFYVTKFSLFFLFTVFNFYSKIRSFMPVFSIRIIIVLNCFYLLILRNSQLESDLSRLLLTRL